MLVKGAWRYKPGVYCVCPGIGKLEIMGIQLRSGFFLEDEMIQVKFSMCFLNCSGKLHVSEEHIHTKIIGFTSSNKIYRPLPEIITPERLKERLSLQRENVNLKGLV